METNCQCQLINTKITQHTKESSLLTAWVLREPSKDTAESNHKQELSGFLSFEFAERRNPYSRLGIFFFQNKNNVRDRKPIFFIEQTYSGGLRKVIAFVT